MANTKVTTGVIKDDAVGADQLASNSVVTASMVDNAVTTAKISDDAILTAKISNSAITNAKMSANSVDSDQYVDGSIDTAHIADSQITSAKLDTNIAVGGTLTLGSHLIMGDGDILKMGAGADLQIYHDGSHSFITDVGTGNLYLRGANSVYIQDAVDNDNMIHAAKDGAVTLYYSNAAKLATATGGVTVTGTLTATTLAGTLSTAAQTNITSLGTLSALTVDDITINGSTISDSGDLTLDVAGAIVFDADGGSIFFNDAGTTIGSFVNNSTDFEIRSNENNRDILLRGTDGGSAITALTLDMSAAGAATFNSTITLKDTLSVNSSSTSGFLQASSNVLQLGSSDSIQFYSNNALAMTLDTSGNFAVGTSSPNAYTNVTTLTVNGTNQGRVDLEYGGTFGGSILALSGQTQIKASGGSQVMAFEVNDAERMRIDTSGLVGIGTQSPTAKLDVRGTVNGEQAVFTGGTNASRGLSILTAASGGQQDAGVIFNAQDTENGAAPYHAFQTAGTQRMKIHASGCIDLGADVDRSLGTNITTTVTSGSAGSGFWLSTGNSSATSSKIISSTNGSVGDLLINQGSGVNGGSIRFSSCDSEKMRINSNGQVCIGNSDLSGALINMRATPSVPSIETRNSTTGATHYALFFRNSGGNEIGFIKISNTGTTYDTGSDYRLKENVESIENGLERLNQLNPVKFDWKADGTSSEGFIAHEVQEIFPDAVAGEKDGEMMQGMDYGRITPLLVKAIQEQQTVIESLTKRIEELEG